MPALRRTPVVAALVAAMAWLSAAVASGTTSLSPTQVAADTTVTFSVPASAGSLEVVTEVTAQFSGVFTFGGCGGPNGWTCSAATGDPTVVTWSRQGLGTEDPTLSLTLTTPVEPGDHTFVMNDRTQTGTTSSNSVRVTVLAPTPSDEPTDEPTEEASEDPTEQPTSRTAPPAEPFRPPDGDNQQPIALGEDRADGPPSSVVVSETPEPAPRARSLTQTAAIPIAGLFLLSAMSFLGAYALREASSSDGEEPRSGGRGGRWVPVDRRPPSSP